MPGKVYANGREIASKSSTGKAVAAFPDVCFTPPQTPATPPGVPIPYANTGMASDTAGGSKTVKINGKEVMLRNKSYFKKSTGDEAGCAPKKGVVTSTNRGKVYFTTWSSDVFFEGQNVVRHLDMTTHNHASMPGNTPPWAYVAGQVSRPTSKCGQETQKATESCAGLKTKAAQCKSKECREAKRCTLVTYNQGKREGKSSAVGCCPGEQPHHLVEVHGFFASGKRGEPAALLVQPPPGKKPYDDKAAPCVCAIGPRHTKEHGQYHAFQGALERAYVEKARSSNGSLTWTYGEARDAGVRAQQAINPHCSAACTKAQLDRFHKRECGLKEDTKLRLDPVKRSEGTLSANQRTSLNRALDSLRDITNNPLA